MQLIVFHSLTTSEIVSTYYILYDSAKKIRYFATNERIKVSEALMYQQWIHLFIKQILEIINNFIKNRKHTFIAKGLRDIREANFNVQVINLRLNSFSKIDLDFLTRKEPVGHTTWITGTILYEKIFLFRDNISPQAEDFINQYRWGISFQQY